MEELLNLLRVQRHDFMNHLQVISGYMQLDKGEQAREYIGQLSLELQKTGQVFRIGDHDLVLQLLIAIQKGFNNQVELVVDLEENIGEVMISSLAKEGVITIANKIIELVKPSHYRENLLISLDIDGVGEGEGYLFMFSIPNTSEVSSEALVELLDSQKELLENGGIKADCNNLEEYHELVLTIPRKIK